MEIIYKDISEYIKSTINNLKNNNINSKKICPKFIEDIKDINILENKKRIFRLKASKYIYYKNTLYLNKNIDYIEINNKITSLIIKGNDDEITDIINNNKKIKFIECLNYLNISI